MLMTREAKYVIYKNGAYYMDVSFLYKGQEKFFEKQTRLTNEYPEEKGYEVKFVSDKRYESREDIISKWRSR